MDEKKKNYSFRKMDPKFLPKVKTGEPPRQIEETTERNDADPTIRCIQYREDNFIENQVASIEELKSVLQSGYYTWINIDGIHDTRVINDIGQAFSLENLSLEDIMNTSSRPKFEEFDDYIYVVIKDLYCPKGDDFGLEQISMIIKESVLITFQ